MLIEGYSKRSKNCLQGRNDQNIRIILPNDPVPFKNGGGARNLKPGDYVAVCVNHANSQVLKAIPLYLTSLEDYYTKSVQHIAIQI